MRRATDPCLTTSDCAEAISMTTEFIVGEIRDGRLKARTYAGGRPRYRIAPADWDAYLARYWPSGAMGRPEPSYPARPI